MGSKNGMTGWTCIFNHAIPLKTRGAGTPMTVPSGMEDDVRSFWCYKCKRRTLHVRLKMTKEKKARLLAMSPFARKEKQPEEKIDFGGGSS